MTSYVFDRCRYLCIQPDQSHETTRLILALSKIPVFLVALAHHALPYPDTLDRQFLLSFPMPPSQLLNQPSVRIIHANRPFSAAGFDNHVIPREMELGQRNLGRCGLRDRGIAYERKGEGRVA